LTRTDLFHQSVIENTIKELQNSISEDLLDKIQVEWQKKFEQNKKLNLERAN